MAVVTPPQDLDQTTNPPEEETSAINGRFTISLDASPDVAEFFTSSPDVSDAVARTIAGKLGVPPTAIHDVRITLSSALGLAVARRLSEAVTAAYSVDVPAARLSESLALLADAMGMGEGLQTELPDYSLEVSEASAAEPSPTDVDASPTSAPAVAGGDEEPKADNPESPSGVGPLLPAVLLLCCVGAGTGVFLNVGGSGDMLFGRDSSREADGSLEMVYPPRKAGSRRSARHSRSNDAEQGPLDMGSFTGVGTVPLSPRY